MTKLEKKLSGIGHGGINCPCCAPRPGSLARRKVVRRGRRRAKELAIKEGLADVSFYEIETELFWEWCAPIYDDYDSGYYLDIPTVEYDDLDYESDYDDLDDDSDHWFREKINWFREKIKEKEIENVTFYNKQFDLLFNDGIY